MTAAVMGSARTTHTAMAVASITSRLSRPSPRLFFPRSGRDDRSRTRPDDRVHASTWSPVGARVVGPAPAPEPVIWRRRGGSRRRHLPPAPSVRSGAEARRGRAEARRSQRHAHPAPWHARCAGRCARGGRPHAQRRPPHGGVRVLAACTECAAPSQRLALTQFGVNRVRLPPGQRMRSTPQRRPCARGIRYDWNASSRGSIHGARAREPRTGGCRQTPAGFARLKLTVERTRHRTAELQVTFGWLRRRPCTEGI